MPPTALNVSASGLNDLTSALPTGMATPTRTNSPAIDTKRKQTLLSLLDALHELSKDEDVQGYGE